MNGGKIILYTGLAGVVGFSSWYIYQQMNLQKGVYVKTINTKMEGGQVVVTVQIYNATSVDVTVNGLHIDIFCKGYNILDAQTTNVVVVKNRASTDLRISIKPNWLSIGAMVLSEGQNILDDLQNWNINDLGLIAKGNLFVGKGNINVPFEKGLKT